jgi:site-specific recombinase XerD
MILGESVMTTPKGWPPDGLQYVSQKHDTGSKSRTALTTVYAAGLRVSEVVLLKIADIGRSEW